jgi:hypothetical protein
MEINMRVNLKIIKKMEKELFIIKMEINTMGISKMIKKMEKE